MPAKRKREGLSKRYNMDETCRKRKPTFCENHRQKNCPECLVNVNRIHGTTDCEGNVESDRNIQTVDNVSDIADGDDKRKDSYRQHTEAASTEFVFRNKRFLGRVNIKCPEDTDPIGSWVYGLVVTADNKLIVCDYNNMAIKMVDIERDRVLCRLATTARPCGITIVDEGKVAVTIPDEFKIMFLRTGGHSLEEENVIETREKCYSIFHHSRNFIVSCLKPRRIVTLDVKGVILTSFRTQTDWQTYNEFPGFLALSSDKQSLYVTNGISSCITQFTMDGQPLNEFAHFDVRGASGIAVDTTGDVYVGTWTSEKGTVIKFSSDLTQPRVFMDEKDGVLLPAPIYLDNEKGMLYLSNSLYIANDSVSMYCIKADK